jgi:hypothetical protein
MKRNIAITFLGTVGALALMATTASAAVVCNDDGDCWKTPKRLEYPPAARVHIYDDDYVLDTKKYRWREARPGAGYYRGGAWVDF